MTEPEKKSIEDALHTATMVMQNDVPIGRMEFVDPKSIRVINQYSGNLQATTSKPDSD